MDQINIIWVCLNMGSTPNVSLFNWENDDRDEPIYKQVEQCWTRFLLCTSKTSENIRTIHLTEKQICKDNNLNWYLNCEAYADVVCCKDCVVVQFPQWICCHFYQLQLRLFMEVGFKHSSKHGSKSSIPWEDDPNGPRSPVRERLQLVTQKVLTQSGKPTGHWADDQVPPVLTNCWPTINTIIFQQVTKTW